MNEHNNELGTLISAEMYSVSDKQKLKQKKKQNTFQQSTPSLTANYVNVDVASPRQVASQTPSGLGVREIERHYGREITKNDLIVDMTCCLAKVRSGNRYHRMNAYFSIKTDTDIRYMIFLRSSLTTAKDEILRSIDNTNNKSLRSIAEDYIYKYKNVFLGRIRYKPTNNFVTVQHRKNLKHGLFAVYTIDDTFYGELYLNGEYYQFTFNNDLTPSQQKAKYVLTAQYLLDEGEME